MFDFDKRLVSFFAESQRAKDFLQEKLTKHAHFESGYEEYLERNGGGPGYYFCECSREEGENFEALQELPSPFSTSSIAAS
ncbi:hypothetical protein AAE478_005324 [Parahypoxylon ruwenzoriense]